MESSAKGNAPDAALGVPGPPQPYAPSYVDRLMRTVERLPVPYWLTYLAAFLLQSVLTVALAWADGWLPLFSVHKILLIDPLWLWGPLAIMTYLNGMSQTAVTSFSPLLDIDQESLARLRYEFTTMPAGKVLLVSAICCVTFLSAAYPVARAWGTDHGVRVAFQWFILFQGVIASAVGGTIYYHSVRQLRLVSRSAQRVREFDLFHLDPLYAFSRLTARTGVAWMLLFTVSWAVVPIEVINAMLLATYALQVVLVIAAFFLPLQFLHQHLVAEKRRLLGDLDQRMKATLAEVHRCIDGHMLGEMEQLERAVKVLVAEREVLAGLPTWPWRTGTLRGFASAVALPIVLFMVQMGIERLLAR